MLTNKQLCQAFIERATMQGLKGKARERAALEFVCGAATVDNRFTGLAFLVSLRGYAKVVEVANKPDEPETQS